MNHWLRAAFAGAALTALLTVPAFAAEDTACAERLDALGLFRGTEAGYELDRAPTRAEAGVMLVRLLGAEEEAQALTYTAPFTDLMGWEQPYVQYLYENGLTTGVSETDFAPNEPCSAQMYAAFLLRALGYSEAAGDFSYAAAVDAAQDYGVYDPAVIDCADFERGDVVMASYTALSCAPKGADGTLLDRLVQDGAVDAQSAQPVQALFTSYAQYRADTAGMAELPAFTIHSEYPGGAAFLRSADGAEVLTLQTQETMSFDRSAGTMQADRVLTLSAPGVAEETVLAGTALSDGVLRRSLNGSQSEQAVTAIAQARLLSCYGPAPLACIADLTQEAADGRWTITFDGLPSLYRELLWPVESTVGSLDGAAIHAVTLQQEVEDGRIVCQRLAADFTSADGICGQPELVSLLELED